jgi:cytokinin riboside 5'-monophosphate phosphoribohydrolase
MNQTVCVFCSSSKAAPAPFIAAGVELGEALARNSRSLIYGGEDIGVMGALARAVRKHSGRVIGVVTELGKCRESVNFALCDEMVVARNFGERKRILEERADAFVVLPGGFGTLDETFEMINWKQLGLHSKPIVIVNVGGHYDALTAVLRSIHDMSLTAKPAGTLYRVVASVKEALEILEITK